MTIVVSKIDAGQEPSKVSVGDSMKVLLGAIVTSKWGNPQVLRNVLRKDWLHLMTSVSKVWRKHQAITLSANRDKDAAGLWPAALKMNGNGSMDQQAQSATEGWQPCWPRLFNLCFFPCSFLDKRSTLLTHAPTQAHTGPRLRGPAAAFPAPSFNNPGN